MKTSATITFRAALAAAALTIMGAPSLALAGQPDSATGAGFFADSSRVFAFSSVRHLDGSVTGQGVLIRPGEVYFHFAINCLAIAPDGKTATLEGVITANHWDGSDADYSGNSCWFRVMDNGEGKKASGPDQMTFFYFNEFAVCTEDCVPATCTDDPGPVSLYPINSGNIQVRKAQ
jgi:hypothetical protein